MWSGDEEDINTRQKLDSSEAGTRSTIDASRRSAKLGRMVVSGKEG